MENVVILIGPTGSGKTSQGKLLAENNGWKHLSTGELLRQDSEMAHYLESGVLASSEVVERVLDTAVVNLGISKTIVLDGFPRLLDEAEWLDEVLSSWQRSLEYVIVLEVSLEVSQARLMLRGRPDDTPKSLARKWHDYENETSPVIDYYLRQGKLVKIDAEGTEEEVYSRIKKVFN